MSINFPEVTMRKEDVNANNANVDCLFSSPHVYTGQPLLFQQREGRVFAAIITSHTAQTVTFTLALSPPTQEIYCSSETARHQLNKQGGLVGHAAVYQQLS